MPHAIPWTVHNPHSRCSRSSPRTPHWRSSRGPGGQDWSPCAASVVICGGHFLLPIHVSHSTASRGGTSEPQRVPTRPPASRSGGVSLLIRYHVEQGRGRALSGSGRPLARTSAGLARRGPLCAGEALLQARTQASVALFKLGAHSATLRPEFGGPKSLRCVAAQKGSDTGRSSC